jgi:hypothetical protein
VQRLRSAATFTEWLKLTKPSYIIVGEEWVCHELSL